MEEKYMREALALAREAAAEGDEPFGAVLVKNGEIVSRGKNRIHTQSDPTAHSEIQAIRNYCMANGTKDLSECTLYTSCEPCFMCSACIVRVKLKKLVYAASEAQCAEIEGLTSSDSSALIFERSRHQPEVVAGFLGDEGVQVLKDCLHR